MRRNWTGWPLAFVVTNSLDQVVGAFTSKAEADAMVAFRGGIVMGACVALDCPNAMLAVADIGDGQGWRALCDEHIFDRARLVPSSDSELVSA